MTRATRDLQQIAELLDALSDTPVTNETHAWFIGHTRNAPVLALRLAARASRRHSATIVYWPDDGTLELTLDAYVAAKHGLGGLTRVDGARARRARDRRQLGRAGRDRHADDG